MCRMRGGCAGGPWVAAAPRAPAVSPQPTTLCALTRPAKSKSPCANRVLRRRAFLPLARRAEMVCEQRGAVPTLDWNVERRHWALLAPQPRRTGWPPDEVLLQAASTVLPEKRRARLAPAPCCAAGERNSGNEGNRRSRGPCTSSAPRFCCRSAAPSLFLSLSLSQSSPP